MHLPRYQYRTNKSYLDYEFVSEGPKGRVRKVVRFLQITDDVYNLGFGDLDEATGAISDTAITNNKDRQKVLTTVASTVYDFCKAHPGKRIFVRGSTPARTRLYRIGITNNWEEISRDFDVYGLKNGEWEPFQLRREYDAFLIDSKEF